MAGVQTAKRKSEMPSHRLPRPTKATRPAVVLDESELPAVERVAFLCRLSVASFIRVALIDAGEHPERVERWTAIAAQLASAEGAAKKGRPKGSKNANPK